MFHTRRHIPATAPFLAVLVASWMVTDACADPIRYASWGVVYSGQPESSANIDSAVSFQGITNGSFDGSSSFSLGTFQVAPLALGASRTYVDAPFTIAVDFHNSSGQTGDDQATISGRLNGTLTSDNSSGLTATIDRIAPSYSIDLIDGTTPPMSSFTGKFFPLDALTVNGPFHVSVSPTAGGTPLLGNVTLAPEPSLALMFLVTAAGLGIGRASTLALFPKPRRQAEGKRGPIPSPRLRGEG
jgi:hypothetical protein